MIKKIVFFLTISFFVFLGTLYFYQQEQKKIKQHLDQLSHISTEIENKQLKEIQNIKIEDTVSSGDNIDKEKIMEKMLAEQLADIHTVARLSSGSITRNMIRYQKIYGEEIKRNNLISAIKAVKYILKYTKHKDIWYKKIVDLYLQVGDFKKAEFYAEKLLKISPLKENLKKYFYIKLQNVNFFDEKSKKEIKDLLGMIYKKNVLTNDDFVFYNFLISLLGDWNTKDIIVSIDMILKDIKEPVKKQLLTYIKNDYKVYKNSKGSPLYYFQSLVALDLLKFGYFGLAKNIAEQVYIQDSSYILPKQILAYSYFYMGNYTQAIKYLKLLQKEDEQNLKEYKFFLGVSYYWIKDYEHSLLFLSQLDKNFTYYLDVLRYKLLSYIKIKDTDNIIKTLNELSDWKLNKVDYYNIFKYTLFKCKDCYNTNTKLIIKLIKKCYQDVDKKEQYVCWFGKANLYQKFGKYKKALPYFKILTKYYQDAYIYHNIAVYYEKHNQIKKARYYYLKELLFTDKENDRKKLKDKIKSLFLKTMDSSK